MPLSNQDFDDLKGLSEANRNDVIDSMGLDDKKAYSDYLDAKMSPPPPPANLVEKMHPVFNGYERAAVQNLAASPDEAAAWLQKNHPGHDIKVFNTGGEPAVPADTQKTAADVASGNVFPDQPPTQYRGATEPEARIYARKKGAAPNDPWMALNPKGMPGSADEALQTFIDHLGQTLTGFGAAAASAYGGAEGAGLGAKLKLPLVGNFIGTGARAGAAASGGLVGGISEAARHAAGYLMGINKEPYSPSAVGESMLGNAAVPLIFGTGAGKANVAAAMQDNPALLGKGIAAQSGLPGAFASGLAKTTGAAMSGIPASAIENARQVLPQVKQLENSGSINDLIDNLQKQVKTSVYGQKQALGESISAAIDGANQPVNISRARAHIDQAIADMETKRGTHGWSEDLDGPQLEQLKQTRAAIFEMPNPAYPPAMQKQGAIQSRLNDVSDQLREATMTAPTPDTAAEVQALAMQQQALQKQLGGIQLPPKTLPKPDFMSAREAMDIRNHVDDKLANFRASNGVSVGRYDQLNEFERNAQLAGSAAYDDLNAAIEHAVDSSAESGATGNAKLGDLKTQYKLWRDYGAQFRSNLMGDNKAADAATYRMLTNMHKNPQTMQDISRLDSELGTEVVSKGNILAAQKLFGDHAEKVAKSGLGRWLGSAVGGKIGYTLGNEAGAVAGAGAGGVAGSAASSPWALRQYMGVGHAFGKIGDFIKNPAAKFGLNLPVPQLVGNAYGPAYVGAPAMGAVKNNLIPWLKMQQEEQGK